MREPDATDKELAEGKKASDQFTDRTKTILLSELVWGSDPFFSP